MKDFTIHGRVECQYKEDCKRIQHVLNDHDFNCSHDQAHSLWAKYSDACATSWMKLPDSDAVLYMLVELYMDFEID